MDQRGIVKELRGDLAVVEVRRSSMCDGCSKADCDGSCTVGQIFASQQTMTALARNEAGASVGDTVVLESAGTHILAMAAVVFILPIVAALLAYFAAPYFGAGETAALLSALGAFLLVFAALIVYEKTKGKGKVRITITKIL